MLWQPPDGQQLPSTEITTLVAARDGTFWIGTRKGLATWKDGRLTQYSELAGRMITSVIESRDGTVWAGVTDYQAGRLCAIHNGSSQCYGEDGRFGIGLFGLFEDSKGGLWVGADKGFWQWKPGPPRFYPVPGESGSIRGFAEDADGTLLIGTHSGIKRLVAGKVERYPLPGTVQKIDSAIHLLRDREGAVWLGCSAGLLHLHRGRVDSFGASDGLSGNAIWNRLFEDREGSIWVATEGGLDRFRNYAVSTFGVKQGLSNGSVVAVMADKDGSVWMAEGGLRRFKDDKITTYDGRDGKLNGLAPHALFQDSHGRLWVSVFGGAGYLQNNRFVSSVLRGRVLLFFVEDKQGDLWTAGASEGLVHLSAGNELEQIPFSKLGHKDLVDAMVADPLRGGVWLGFFDGGVAYYKEGAVHASYAAADGFGKGRVNSLRFGSHGTLWAATNGGLSRIRDGHVITLTSKNGLPCDTVHWSIEDDEHSVWLYTPCGLVRVAQADLDSWVKDPARRISTTNFDTSDGVLVRSEVGSTGPLVTKAADGRLWFATLEGAGVVDPRHLPHNSLAPPVHIEQITADGKGYDASAVGSGRLKLPALVRYLDIDYTALSLVAPEKVRFRVKLDGQDNDWRELVNVRHVEYSNLAPKTYRFLVKACNNSGVWNEEGAALAFTIPPMWYQTNWFLALCVATFLALLWALYQYRLHQLARQFQMALDTRVAERTSIARDLHDTLLQSFHGILLHLQIVSQLLPERPVEAQDKLHSTIDQAEQAIIEGRDAVQGLRASTVERNDLAAAIRTLGEELAPAGSSSQRPQFSVEMEGAPRKLHPILRDEVYRIAGEGMRNAFRHANAQRIEVEIRYDERQLRVRVRDDGKGVDLKLMGDNGREGHFGLRGMRERAKLIGGKLTLWSELDSGTEVELTIPAARAYVTAPEPRRSRLVEKLAGKLTGKDTELRS